MEKTIYASPETGIVEVENEGFLCGSDFESEVLESYVGTDSFEKLF